MADQYLHYPRGSNNRLNEKSANRNNGNRLFDSQNNNRGGYNVGEFDDTQGFVTNRDTIHTKAEFDAREDLQFNYLDYSWNDERDAGDNGRRQNEDVYMEGSELLVTWTSQHGCGNEKNNCNMVLEYTCDTHPVYENILDGDGASIANSEKSRQSDATRGVDANGNVDDSQLAYTYWDGMRVQLINGLNTNTPDDPNNLASIEGTFQNNNDNKRGRHESEEYYEFGQKRHRNKGLFTADQNLQGNAQKYTRQNPGGTRRGLEIPEERDYFPWTHPSPWRPVAILTNDVEECEEKMQAHTQQAEPKCACAPSANDIATNNDDIVRAQTEEECTTGQWKCHQYTTMDPPPCVQNKWSQANNLGNVDGTEDGGLPQTYAWTLPSVQDMADTGCWKYRRTMSEGTGNTFDYIRWVFRIRYNMTTGDYSPYETDARCNDNRNNYKMSPIEQNPTVDIGVEAQGLRLAINTAQLGRTFQDRTHVMTLMERPAALQNKKVWNLNVQGKRGNIVQTFPAVEYDYWPKKLEVKTNECIAMSWTGSNTHNNGNPAGDGQAGDAGEGTGGTDRHNFMQYTEKKNSYPYPLDKFEDAGAPQQMLKDATVYKTHTGEVMQSGADGNWENYDAQAYLLSGGFYQTMTGNNGVGEFGGDDGELQELLNNAPATMRSVTVCPGKAGEFVFGCTRNNNFSNRDQKFILKVTN
jgi:hypothetical protein